MPWLTGNGALADDYICRTLRIPNDIALVTAVTGALHELTKPYNWEKFGSLDDQSAAQLAMIMFREYLNEDGECIVPQIAEIGEIRHFMRHSLPDGWLLCDGSKVLVADYPELAAVLPALLVSGDDITLPNLVERVLHGATTIAGNVGGANSVTLQDFNLPPHRHRYNGGLPVFLPLDFGTLDNSGQGANVPTRNRTLEATVTDTQDTVQSFLDVIPVDITPAHVTALPGIYAGA